MKRDHSFPMYDRYYCTGKIRAIKCAHVCSVISYAFYHPRLFFSPSQYRAILRVTTTYKIINATDPRAALFGRALILKGLSIVFPPKQENFVRKRGVFSEIVCFELGVAANKLPRRRRRCNRVSGSLFFALRSRGECVYFCMFYEAGGGGADFPAITIVIVVFATVEKVRSVVRSS